MLPNILNVVDTKKLTHQTNVSTTNFFSRSTKQRTSLKFKRMKKVHYENKYCKHYFRSHFAKPNCHVSLIYVISYVHQLFRLLTFTFDTAKTQLIAHPLN